MTIAAAPSTVNFVWWGSIILALVVTVVVAVLLTGIVRAARRIHQVAADIWTHGQRVANNTVHIALLDRTNFLFKGILTEAAGVAKAAGQIEEAVTRGGNP